MQDLKVVDLDTAHTLPTAREGNKTVATLEVPITADQQSAHLRVTGTVVDPAYTTDGSTLTFSRTLKGLRNTILLPAGWEVAEVSQSATLGRYNNRVFVALINLNHENQYTVKVRASRAR